MRKKIIAASIIGVIILSAVCGCNRSDNEAGKKETNIEQTKNDKENNSNNSQSNNASATRFDINVEHVEENEQTVAVKSDGKISGEGADIVVEATEKNLITFDGGSVNTKADGVEVKGSTVTVSREGTYVVTGVSQNGQIIVDTEDKGTVWIILADADITNTVNSPVYVKNAKKNII